MERGSHKLTYGSLFTGCGCFDLAAENAGMTGLWQVERDRDCIDVLTRHFPDRQRIADVIQARAILEPKNAGKCATRLVRPELIIGGFPCQDLSVAGRRSGLAGSRSGMWYVFRRILGVVRPRWVFIENVPGLLSSQSGRDMGIILRALGNLGYGYAYRVLDAQWFGVAQRRRRVFVVGCLGNVRRAAEVLFESNSLPWDSPPSRKARTRVAASVAGCLNSGGNSGGFRSEPGEHLVPSLSKCLTAKAGYRSDLDTETFIAHTLRGEGFDASEDGTGRGTPLVPVAFAQNQRDEVRDLNNLAGAIAAEPGMKQQTYIATNSVRRLTPRECERLQGLPDDWTRYRAGGSEISDSARYRMLGNSGALPKVQWIMERIARAD